MPSQFSTFSIKTWSLHSLSLCMPTSMGTRDRQYMMIITLPAIIWYSLRFHQLPKQYGIKTLILMSHQMEINTVLFFRNFITLDKSQPYSIGQTISFGSPREYFTLLLSFLSPILCLTKPYFHKMGTTQISGLFPLLPSPQLSL